MLLKILALIGSSGTGKSHRANIVAHNLGAEVIIDDGLLIKDNRIIAGMSAKSQATRIGAIKTALFMSSEHAEQAKKVLSELAINKVLILGTSKRMVERIAQRLGLQPVSKFINIEDVASLKEIRKARMMRSQYSKHVIPAPTVEVRKSLPEILIDPLQIFLRRKCKTNESKSWLEQSVVRPTFTYYGNLAISHTALISIASISAKQVDGVLDVKSVNISKTPDGIIINIDLILLMGISMNIVCQNVQAEVKFQMENMTGLFVKAINILVCGLRNLEVS